MKKLTMLLAVAFASSAGGDEFTREDVARWEKEYQVVVKKGRQLWISAALGTNGASCAQCHPNAANTHPETYPKFQKQLGRVATLREMINWCLRNPLEGRALPAEDPKMIALEAYANFERRGVPLAPGRH